jgi:hypothetical protein
MNMQSCNMQNRLTYRGQSRAWTNKDVARLRYLWDELGCTSGECAKLMGRSRSAITAAVCRHGLKARGCPIPVKPDLIRQRQEELARIAAIEELMRAA